VKIYTKTGDDGKTGLYGGSRVPKDDLRIEAIGTVDELNALLGWTRAEGLPPGIDQFVFRIQNQLFDLGAELASPVAEKSGQQNITERQIRWLEDAIDQHEASLKPLKEFILPGGSSGGARLQLARSICRRAERRVISLASVADSSVSNDVVVYLNRLSDFLFVVARCVNRIEGKDDVVWEKGQ
jgi:cob(I)alamin adenosyltransferase